MFSPISKRALAAATVIAAASLPSAAIARPLEEMSGVSETFTTSPPPAQIAVPQPAAQADQGFHWDDAGLGAAGMLVLVGVGSGAAVAVRRHGSHALTG